MKSKYFYQDHKDLIKEEHKKYDTHQENQDVVSDRCDHMGKVKFVDGNLRCVCGASWSGPQLDTLFALFQKK